MEQPVIADSARKHGVSDDDMLHAFDHPMFVHELREEFVMIVGPARNANLLEVGVVVGTDGPVIIHAMTARTQYLR